MRILLIALMVLIVSTAYGAEDYLDSLQEYSAVISQNLNISTTSKACPDSMKFRSVRSAAIVVAQAIYGNFMLDTVVATADDYDYALDSLIKVKYVNFKSTDTVLPLIFTPMVEWRSLKIPRTLTGQSGVLAHPSYYDWDNGYLFLYPTPHAADTFIVYGFGKLANIISDSTFVTDLEVNYRPSLEALATALTALKLKMYDEHTAWMTVFEREIALINGVKQ